MASTKLYAEMVKEDRFLRLAGYEVYRFGGNELAKGEPSRQVVREFFAALISKHRLRLGS